jgi:hypothetical protein
MRYKIRYAAGHVEVFNEQGEFVFSADSEHEAREELRAIEAA